MKKITVIIIIIFSISGAYAQKNKFPRLETLPIKDSIITLQSDSNYVKMYMLTPVAEEIVKTFPGMISITCCNRRLAEMRIDLNEFDSLVAKTKIYSTDFSSTTMSFFRYQKSDEKGKFLLFQKSSKCADIRETLYFQVSDNLWYFAEFNNGLCSIVSSSSTINEVIINIKPRKRGFTKSSMAPLRFFISTTSKKDHFLKIFLRQLENSN